MKSIIIALGIIISTLSTNPNNFPVATVDRIEDGNIAVIEVYDRSDGNIYMGEVPVDFINGNASPGASLPVHSIMGTFTGPILDTNGNLYFKFEGNNETWTLSESELGFTPKAKETYTLFVSDNGTEDIYDDIFVCVKC